MFLKAFPGGPPNVSTAGRKTSLWTLFIVHYVIARMLAMFEEGDWSPSQVYYATSKTLL
jgi:hypothetical protein